MNWTEPEGPLWLDTLIHHLSSTETKRLHVSLTFKHNSVPTPNRVLTKTAYKTELTDKFKTNISSYRIKYILLICFILGSINIKVTIKNISYKFNS